MYMQAYRQTDINKETDRQTKILLVSHTVTVKDTDIQMDRNTDMKTDI